MQGKTPFLFLFLLSVLCSPFSAHSQKSDWDFYQKQGHHSPKWDALVEAGFDTFESENSETSVNFLKRAVTLGCKDGLVFYKLALIIESGGNLRGALETLDKAAPLLRSQYKEHPATKILAEHLGNIYYQLGRYDEALPQFLEAIETDGENFLRLYLAGQIYRMQQNPKEAIPYFEKALTHPLPQGVPSGMKRLAQIELMKLYFDAGALDQSLAMANEILKEEPMNPAAISTRDKIAQKRFQEKERETWKKVLERN